MREGTMLGARFALGDEVDCGIPGIERHLAEDTRLRRTTIVDLVQTKDPAAVRREAMRAARLRDPRLARIVATGQEAASGQTVTYIASEHVPGISVADLLSRHRLDARRAVALVGGAARALAVAHAAGQSHGFLRDSCLTVTSRGRVVVAGVGVDGEAAHQSGLVGVPDEGTDARALATLLIRAVTGEDASEATADDLPDGMPSGARALALETMRGAPPATLAAVVTALAAADARALVGLDAVLDTLPLRPAIAREEAALAAQRAAVEERRLAEEGAAARALIEPATVAAATAAADLAQAERLTGEPVDQTVRHALDELTASSEPPTPPADAAAAPAVAAEPEVVHAPADRHEAAFDTLEIMVAAQNVEREPGTWELVLESLHRRWPRSEGIARSLRRAQERANSGGPLDGSRVVMAVGVVALLLALVVALIWLGAPLGDGVVIEPDPTGVPGPVASPPSPASSTPSP